MIAARSFGFDLQPLFRFWHCRSFIFSACCALVVFGATGCNKKKVSVATPTASSGASLQPGERIGYASWYGDPYHGRRTSNGETYNKYSLTAAHRTLPFDTLVKVNNLENGKNVKVRINDRGPFVKDRIIDLSYAAAQQIDMLGHGTAKVSLDILDVVPNPYPLTIQVASFRNEDYAKKLKGNLQRHFTPVLIRKFELSEGQFFRVLVGQFSNKQLASAALKELKSLNYDGLIVRLDP